MAVLVDSNVLIDLAVADPVWADWSAEALDDAAMDGELIINAVIFAEVSVGFADIELLDALLPRSIFRREDVPWEAAFLAGKVFLDYRRSGGFKGGVLPDFMIGAHAAVRGYEVLTRDPKRYRHYFPTLGLRTPET